MDTVRCRVNIKTTDLLWRTGFVPLLCKKETALNTGTFSSYFVAFLVIMLGSFLGDPVWLTKR